MTNRPKLDEIADALGGGWDQARASIVRYRAVEQARRRQRRQRRLLAAAALLLPATAGWLMVSSPRPSNAPPIARVEPPSTNVEALPRAAASARSITFEDGSRADLVGAGSALRLVRRSPNDLTVALTSGSARFSVVPDARRVFRVETSAVAVEVVGTVFSIARTGDRAKVTVEIGRATVSWGDHSVVLQAGEAGLYPPSVEDDEVRSPRTERRDASDWKRLARSGRYQAAYDGLHRLGEGERARALGAPTDELLAADVARLSNHPDEAASLLRRFVERHPRDERAAAAAFTLGRVAMDEQHDARAGARAFERALELAPSGPLAEDALARAAIAWSRAGDQRRASEAAADYLRRYPRGAHASALEGLARRR